MNATISRLRDAMNAHDAERMAAQFAPNYRSEQPAHPNRGFGGHAQVAANWSSLYRAVTDLVSEVVAEVADGPTVWVEWHWRGHYADRSLFESRGVTISDLTDDGLIAAQRLYIEQVEHDGAAIQETVRQLAEPAR